MTQITTLRQACEQAKVAKIAEACGITPRAIYKWLKVEMLPKEVFTGEKDYDKQIARLLNYKLTPAQVRELGKRVKH